jgi:hypothetical protein
MKSVILLGKEYFYEISYGEYAGFYTKFGTRVVKKYSKKWLFCVPLIEKEILEDRVFLVYFNIENGELTKFELRETLEKELKKEFKSLKRIAEIQDRIEEIKRGELI